MLCPLCETDNPDDLPECTDCGKQLHTDAQVLEDVAPLPGLEETMQLSVDVPAETMADLERTLVARSDLRVQVEVVPGVERTQLEEDPSAPINWSGQVVLDRGREEDLDPRTEAPQDDGRCPWCGVEASGAVCDSCGRRRSRYTAALPVPAAPQSSETVLCPACFARVAAVARCVECGVPLSVAGS
jgi:hypothetical protein